LDVVTRGAIIAFSTSQEPQSEQVTIPAALSFSKASADLNQLSKEWFWSHFKE